MAQIDPFSTEYNPASRKQAFTNDGFISFSMLPGDRKKTKQNSRSTPVTQLNEKEAEDQDNQSVSIAMSNFANDVSILGMKQIVNPKLSPLRRAVWLCFVLAGTGFLVYHLWNRLEYYFSNPASVNIRVNYDGSLLFPTLTICNNNMFQKSKLAANNETELGDLFQPTFGPPPDWSRYNFTGYNWTDFYVRNGNNLTDIYGGLCYWKSAPCNLDVFRPVVTEYGLCHQFNAGDEKLRSEVEGSSYGLWISLVAKQEEYLVGSFIAGFTVHIHNAGDFPDVMSQGFQIAPGGSTNVAIKQKYVKNLPAPHGQCADKKLAYFSSYSKVNCHTECIFNSSIDICGCGMPFHPKAAGFPDCSPYDMNTCYFPRIVANISQVVKGCHCTEACESYYYEYTATNGKVSEISAKAAAVHMNTTQAYIENNYLFLMLYYKEMSYEEVIQQEAYSSLTLMADIGGALGLVLGSTLMTVAEIFDFVLGLSVWKLCGIKL